MRFTEVLFVLMTLVVSCEARRRDTGWAQTLPDGRQRHWVKWRLDTGLGVFRKGFSYVLCSALHITALYCTALHCSTLYCTALYCTVLF